jgi:capsular polysaccharide biosynthesis protein
MSITLAARCGKGQLLCVGRQVTIKTRPLIESYAKDGWNFLARDLADSGLATRHVVVEAEGGRRSLALYSIERGVVLGMPGCLATADGQLLGESVIYPAIPLNTLHEGALEADFWPGSYLFLDGIYAEYFWHWIMEYLPRVILAERGGFDGKYVLSPHVPPFSRQSLELLGISAERIVIRTVAAVVAENLFLVDPFTGTKGHGRNDITQYPEMFWEIRNRFRAPESDVSHRLYISRHKSNRARRVTNEEELIPILERFQFRMLYLEELDLRQQLALTSHAGAIAGPHGAGMLHALFMKEGGSVLEICAPSFTPDTNSAIHHLLGQRHSIFHATEIEDPALDPNLRDMTVDPSKFENFIAERLS